MDTSHQCHTSESMKSLNHALVLSYLSHVSSLSLVYNYMMQGFYYVLGLQYDNARQHYVYSSVKQ